MMPKDVARENDDKPEETTRDGAVAIETETGLLVYEPGQPDAWIHADCEREVTE